MLYLISLLVVALAAMGVAVATHRHPLVACPMAGFAAGALLVEAALLWLLAWDVAAAAAAACGVSALLWGVRLWWAWDVAVREAERDRLRAERYDRAGRYTQHDVAVENILGGGR